MIVHKLYVRGTQPNFLVFFPRSMWHVLLFVLISTYILMCILDIVLISSCEISCLVYTYLV